MFDWIRSLRRSSPNQVLKQALALDPKRGEAHLHLGLQYWRSGRMDEALAALQAAVKCDPRLADAQFHLGNLLRERGRTEESVRAYRAAVHADPKHADAHNNLASLLRDQGQVDEALPHYRQAVCERPGFAVAWFNLGTLLRDLGQLDEAVEALRRSLELDPKQADAQYWLGNALMGRGDAQDAVAAYRAALRLDAQFLRARWGLAMAQITPIPMTESEAQAAREGFALELGNLATWCRTHRPADGYRAVGAQQPYYLAYQERSNRELLGQYGTLCSELMQQWQKEAGLSPAQARAAGGKCRVGIVSSHFNNHSVWNAIVRGWLEHFDRSKIALHLFHTGTLRDAETAYAAQRAAQFHAGPRDWTAWAKAIADSRLDALVFPEVGMDSVTAKLAALRLAPIQVASWGHPETTGLPTIDHYVSAHGMEPAGAQQHYSERLTLLPRLGCCYRRFGTAAAGVGPANWGIAPGTRILLCPGTPFKYAPLHDRWLVEIARRTAPSRLVFFRAQPEALSLRLEQRLRAAFAKADLDFNAHVAFIPWQNQAAFFGLMAQADVLLDSPGFSGFNTAMQAIECGLPIVAYEGAYLRGRFASGILRQMGLDQWIADSEEGYVERAVSLCTQRGERDALRARLIARRAPLFSDVRSARAMQDWLFGVAGHGNT
jgi:predicted O-linked N-acetylglucosamine transferase (SPINDLY family)